MQHQFHPAAAMLKDSTMIARRQRTVSLAILALLSVPTASFQPQSLVIRPVEVDKDGCLGRCWQRRWPRSQPLSLFENIFSSADLVEETAASSFVANGESSNILNDAFLITASAESRLNEARTSLESADSDVITNPTKLRLDFPTNQDMDTALESFKLRLQSPRDGFEISPPAEFQRLVDSFDGMRGQLSSENTLRTFLSTKKNLIDFGDYYVSSLDSSYKLSEFRESLSSGELATKSLEAVAKGVSGILESLDLKENAAFVLLVATFFWGSTQRRDGIRYGRESSELKIVDLETKLKAARRKASDESDAKAAEIEELKEQMKHLTAQVEALATATQAVAQQTQQTSVVTEPVQVDTSPATIPEIGTQKRTAKTVAKKSSIAAAKKVSTKNTNVKKTRTKKQTKESKDSEDTMEIAEISIEKRADDQAPATATTEKVPIAKKSRNKPKTSKQAKKAVVKGETKLKKTSKSPSKQKAEKKEEPTVRKAAKTEVSTNDVDWTTLAESTLKRKTVKELAGYLSGKGVSITDTNGKALKKKDLVELVQTS